MSFKEPEWDADVPDKIKFNFVKQTQNVEISKNLKTKLNEVENCPGKYVRVQKNDNNDSVEKLSKKSKRKKNVKVEEKNIQNTEENGKEITKNKNKKRKLKEQDPVKNSKKINLSLAAVGKPVGKEKHGDKNSIDLNHLRESLKGSRFRFLNEQLYTSKSENAKRMFDEDPEAFEAYHVGYRHQIEQWSLNPLNRIIKSISKLPTTQIIADFGCGDARLSKSVKHKVYSLDLISQQDNVIACDMSNTPLEKSSVHVVVFCLSLMGTNTEDFILEANRVLKDGGLMEIAEVRSRFTNENLFISSIEKCGFKILNKDLTNKLFYFMKFKKIKNVNKNMVTNLEFNLRPCLYKKR